VRNWTPINAVEFTFGKDVQCSGGFGGVLSWNLGIYDRGSDVRRASFACSGEDRRSPGSSTSTNGPVDAKSVWPTGSMGHQGAQWQFTTASIPKSSLSANSLGDDSDFISSFSRIVDRAGLRLSLLLATSSISTTSQGSSSANRQVGVVAMTRGEDGSPSTTNQGLVIGFAP